MEKEIKTEMEEEQKKDKARGKKDNKKMGMETETKNKSRKRKITRRPYIQVHNIRAKKPFLLEPFRSQSKNLDKGWGLGTSPWYMKICHINLTANNFPSKSIHSK